MAKNTDKDRKKDQNRRDANVNNERTRGAGIFNSKNAEDVDDIVTRAQTGRPARSPASRKRK